MGREYSPHGHEWVVVPGLLLKSQKCKGAEPMARVFGKLGVESINQHQVIGLQIFFAIALGFSAHSARNPVFFERIVPSSTDWPSVAVGVLVPRFKGFVGRTFSR